MAVIASAGTPRRGTHPARIPRPVLPLPSAPHPASDRRLSLPRIGPETSTTPPSGPEAGTLLLHQPAGPFFALAALFAVALPWPWLLHWPDAAVLHVRLGIFGMAGAAVAGYLLTARRAWTGGGLSVPVSWLAAVWLAGRIATLAFPDRPELAPVSALVVGAVLLAPVLAARAWGRLPVALFLLLMGPAEAAFIAGRLPPASLATLLALLLALVGGRAVPAFLAAEATRRGWPVRPPAWPALIGPVAIALAHLPPLRVVMLLAAGLWCLARLRHRHAGRLLAEAALSAPAMLVWGWGLLAAGLAATALGWPSPVAGLHLLTLGAAGGMIFAISARAGMRRVPGRGLVARRRQSLGFVLLLAAAGLRLAAEFFPGALMLSGLCWSAAWLCHLAAHLPALFRPAPRPMLSAPFFLEEAGATPGP